MINDHTSEADMIERAAAKLYRHRHSFKTWDQIKRVHPDIAEVYRDNARICLDEFRKVLATKE